MKKIPCEIYSRIVGYFRPVKEWNLGKQSEFEERVTCKVDINKLKDYEQKNKKPTNKNL